MADFPGVGFSFTQPIDMRVSEMLTGVRGDLAIKIYGTDLVTLNQLAEQTVASLKKVPGAEDTFTLRNDGVQYLKIAIDRLAAGRFGLNVDDVQNDLKSLLEGRIVGTVIEEGRRTPLVLRGPAELRSSPADFEALRLSLPNGGSVPLASVAKIERIDGPVKVDRENAQRYVVIQSNVRDRDLVGFVEDAKAAVARDIKLPQGYRVAWGGQFENQQRAAARLMIVVPVALLLIFFLLFSTFGSVRQALLVLSNIPFAMIVTYFNQLLAKGMAVGDVVVEGAKRRLRPVLMTASIAAFGLVPMLFASGPGSEVQRPLAIVVIGGLLTSTALTLVLLPVLFRRFGVKTTVNFTEKLNG
jgi:cobalt-zinc-cadmium resistance protein CzcA